MRECWGRVPTPGPSQTQDWRSHLLQMRAACPEAPAPRGKEERDWPGAAAACLWRGRGGACAPMEEHASCAGARDAASGLSALRSLAPELWQVLLWLRLWWPDVRWGLWREWRPGVPPTPLGLPYIRSDSITWAPGGHACARPKHPRSSLGGTRGQRFVSGRMLIRDKTLEYPAAPEPRLSLRGCAAWVPGRRPTSQPCSAAPVRPAVVVGRAWPFRRPLPAGSLGGWGKRGAVPWTRSGPFPQCPTRSFPSFLSLPPLPACDGLNGEVSSEQQT